MAAGEKLKYRVLREDEIQRLESQGCTSEDWNTVQVAEPFRSDRVRGVDFIGKSFLGSLAGYVQRTSGFAKPCGIYNGRVQDCVIGGGVRIANVGSHLAGYHIGNDVLIENVGVMEAHAGARFGNGVEVVALN